MSNVHYLATPVQTSALGRHKPPMLRYRPPVATVAPLWSHDASWNDLTYLQTVEPSHHLLDGRGRRWTLAFKHGSNLHTEPVMSVAVGDLLAADPMIKNSWHQKKTSRAGLRYVDSTDELHAHASMFERKLLLALDFHGVTAVAAQPFTLSYDFDGQTRHHTPDFLAWVDGVPTVINCRPASEVDARLLEDVAALGAIGLCRGWENNLVVGYAAHAYATVDAWTAHSTRSDFLGYGEALLDRLGAGPLRFDELTSGFASESASRAIAQLLLWDRELSANLAEPFDDDTLIHLPDHVRGGAA